MAKIGNTDSEIFRMVLQQYFAVVAAGGELKMAFPPDAPENGYAATFTVPYDFGSPKPEPLVVKALHATSDIVLAIGKNRIGAVEKLPVADDEEIKYVITIKK
jgi:hypothetical protein